MRQVTIHRCNNRVGQKSNTPSSCFRVRNPQPPSLMVLNEPETSLHPDLVRPLASLIQSAAGQTQVIVVTHSRAMLEFLDAAPVSDADEDSAVEIELYKEFGETRVKGLGMLTIPPWDWGKR